MKTLIGDMKSGNYKKAYLFFGEERYLVRLYEKKLKEKLLDPSMEMMNCDIFEGKTVAYTDVENAINTLPFMCGKRLVIVRQSGLFAAGRKEQTDKFAGIIDDIPETTVLLFVEADVDRRNKLYKTLNLSGRCIDFKTPETKELADWICRMAAKAGKRITVKAALSIINIVAHDMETIEEETFKALSYVGAREDVSLEDIELVCTRSPETKIFDLVDAIGNKDAGTALDIFSNMLTVKMSPIMVITMIARQFRLILQSRQWEEKGIPTAQIAANIGQRPFIVSRCLQQGKHFTISEVKKALEDCLEADLNVKTGKMGDKLAVELLILKYAGIPR